MTNLELIKKNSYQLIIITIYAIILSIVYGYMAYVFTNKIWVLILIVGLILLTGFVVAILYINKQKKSINLADNTKELKK